LSKHTQPQFVKQLWQQTFQADRLWTNNNCEPWLACITRSVCCTLHCGALWGVACVANGASVPCGIQGGRPLVAQVFVPPYSYYLAAAIITERWKPSRANVIFRCGDYAPHALWDSSAWSSNYCIHFVWFLI